MDRHAPKPGDSAAVAAWRERMGTEPAKAIYKERASTAECVNAQARGRGLLRLPVRGLAKVKAIALWHALAHNLLRAARLRPRRRERLRGGLEVKIKPRRLESRLREAETSRSVDRPPRR